MAGQYEDLSRVQLVALLEKRDRQRKLGLVWERDEIEADKAIDTNFVAAALVDDLCEGPAPWSNLVIEADNFDALRWLRMTLAGQIKCIYVDPPYNTGNKDFVYNDHFLDAHDRFRHSTWLEFLYRRFTIARDLLTEDGVIPVSINDENRALLELMLDEALPGMKRGSLTWRSRTGGNEGGEAFLSMNHEHVLVYAKPAFRFAGSEKSYEEYSNPDKDDRGDWQSDNLTQSKTRQQRPNSYFPLHDPETDIYYPANPDSVWRYTSRQTSAPGARIRTKVMEDWIAERQILFPKDQRVETWNTLEDLKAAIAAGDVPQGGRALLLRDDLPDLAFWVGRKVGFGTPRFKRFKRDLKNSTQPLSSWITPKSEVSTLVEGDNTLVSATNDEGSRAIQALFGGKVFSYPKPPSLIRGLISQASSANDIVLDFFAGSATTAQAVLELNAEDRGERRYIMVSSTEATPETPDKNVCRDICAERLRILNRSEDPKFAALATRFAYLKTRSIPLEDIDYEVAPGELWAILEQLHGLPLTPYDVGSAINAHLREGAGVVYVDSLEGDGAVKLTDLVKAHPRVILYAWAPGQVRAACEGLQAEIRSVHDVLMQRFAP